MTLAFAEKWAQLRVLRNVSFWLKPQSRSFDSSCLRLSTVEQLEKLCGPIRGAHFDEGLLVDAINPALDLAEGILAEYASTLGYKPVGFKYPADYSLITNMEDGDPGEELDLVLTVLQTLVDGNEAVSQRAEITERLAKLRDAKTKLDNDESDLPRIFATLEDRILHCDGVSMEEIEEFTDQIDRDATHQNHLATFRSTNMDRGYLLKGVKHVQFLQRAYQNTRTINSSFYSNLCPLMSSVVARLTEEELESALLSSHEHFERVKARSRDYFPLFSTVLRSEEKGQRGIDFIARLLLLGPFVVSNELVQYLKTTSPLYRDKTVASCAAMLHEMPPSIYRMLLGKTPYLARVCFPPIETTATPDFRVSVQLLILSNVFPLRSLLNGILLDTVRHYKTFVKIFSCDLLKGCIERIKSEDWDATVQALIKSMGVVAERASGVNKETIKALLEHIANKNGDDATDLTWLYKHGDQDKLIQWIDGEPEPKDDTADWNMANAAEFPAIGEQAKEATSLEKAIDVKSGEGEGEDEVDGGQEKKEEGEEDEGKKEVEEEEEGDEKGQEDTVEEVKEESEEVPQTLAKKENEASSTDQGAQSVAVDQVVESETEERAGRRRRKASDPDPTAIDHELESIEEEEVQTAEEAEDWYDTEGEFEYDGMSLEQATQSSMNSPVDGTTASINNIDQI